MTDIDDLELRAAEARVGQLLRGKWKLERLLGVGGMASVYAAVHRNGLRGAVKMLHPAMSTFADARERFLREGYAANSVGHAGAVRVLDDDVIEDGSVFLVMELLEGQSLEALADRHGFRLTPGEVAAVGDQLLDVLAAAHDKRIWHRDLKPENLFLTRAGAVKVLDFGIAKIKQAGPSARATSTGSLMGTPAFMPPEQALGKWSLVDGRSDLWAVGATLLNLLTGLYLHEGDTSGEMLVSAATRPIPPVRTLDPNIPEPLAAVLDRALAFRIEDRWPDARSMQAALRAACGSGDLSRLLAAISGAPRAPSQTPLETTVPQAPPLAPTESLPVTPAPTYALPEAANAAPLVATVTPELPPGTRSLGWIVLAAAAALVLLPALALLSLKLMQQRTVATAESAAPSIEVPEPVAATSKPPPEEPKASSEPRATAPPKPPRRAPAPPKPPRPASSAKPPTKFVQQW